MYRNFYCLFFAVLLFGLLSNSAELKAASSSRTDKDKAVSLDTDPNLVGWWKFDDISGTTATDSSRHKRNGQLKGRVSFKKDSVPGRIGKALKLDGDDDYVQITGYKGVTGPPGSRLQVAEVNLCRGAWMTSARCLLSASSGGTAWG